VSNQLSEGQVIDIAYSVLPPRDADIFVWHHWGRSIHGQPRSPKWTFGELARHFRLSFRDVTRSLRESGKVMFEAVQTVQQTMLEIVVTEGLQDSAVPMNFTVTLQMGSTALPRVDITAKRVLTRIHRGESAA